MIWEILIVVGIILFVMIRFISNFKEQEIKEVKKEYHIQEGEIHYTDLDKPAKPIFSHKLRLVGKPDYIVKQKETHIPVEIKKGGGSNPFPGHIIQLIAYCYLVEDKYKTKVPYGILVYDDYQIKIPYNETKKKELLEVINIMRTQNQFHRSHNSINKCNACPFNYICEEKLFDNN